MRTLKMMMLPLSAALGFMAFNASIAPAQAPKTYTLKFNHVLGPKEPYHQGFMNWAKRVEERTKGGAQDRRLPFRTARPGRGHHRADSAGRQHRPEHRLRAHGQLRARHCRDEWPLFRRDARGRGEAAQVADRRALAGGTGEQVRSQGDLVQLGAGLPALLHQQAGQDARRPEGPAHPHASGADLAGIHPRARRGAGRDGIR